MYGQRDIEHRTSIAGTFNSDSILSLRSWCFCFLIYLRWNGTLKYSDFHEKSNFLKIQHLRPLNTCPKHFDTTLTNFREDECEI